MFTYRKLTGIALLGLLAFALDHEANSAQENSAQAEPVSLNPIEAGSFSLGATHIVAFYVPQAGRCAVTAVVEEIVGDAPSASPARVRFDLAPGTRAFIDNAGGRSVALECGADAQVLTIERQDLSAELVTRAGS
jgi:hypothetical protein